jgi:ADP-ribose pyrophosphatase YjhB (NUDIX family)
MSTTTGGRPVAPLPVGGYAGVGPDGAVQRVRLAAYAWIEQDGCVLLVRISLQDAAAGQWTLPGGGLAFGEDPADGVLREIREETGLDATLGELLGVRSAILEPHQTQSGHRIQNVGVLYRASVASMDLVNEADGSTDLAEWVPFERLGELPVVPLVRWARERVGR